MQAKISKKFKEFKDRGWCTGGMGESGAWAHLKAARCGERRQAWVLRKGGKSYIIN